MLQKTIPIISVITRIELFASAKISSQELLTLEQFVEIATVHDTINLAIINHPIHIRQQYRTALPDAIIAATALVLISRNISDFKNIQGLQVIDPYKL